MASSINKGKRGSDALMTNIWVTWSSTSFCVHDSILVGANFTTPSTSIILSLVILNRLWFNEMIIYFHVFYQILLPSNKFNHLFADCLACNNKSLYSMKSLSDGKKALFILSFKKNRIKIYKKLNCSLKKFTSCWTWNIQPPSDP